jgi:hypothetical protein
LTGHRGGGSLGLVLTSEDAIPAGVVKMLEVTSAEYVKGYKIRLRFNNGEEGIVDLKDSLWGPMFEPLKDVNTFRRFKVLKCFSLSGTMWRRN